MRLFIALDLSEQVRARVAEVVERERATVDARWARAEGLHLTLVFFGDVPAQRLAPIVSAATAVAVAHHPFRLGLEGAGTFGTGLPRVLWLGVTGALAPLQALVAELAAALQLPSEHPDYRPHLTLARSRVRHGDPMLLEVAKRLAPKSFGTWSVDHFTVYETAGGRYRCLATVSLG